MTASFASSAQARAQPEHKSNGCDDRESFRQAGVIRNAPDVDPKVVAGGEDSSASAAPEIGMAPDAPKVMYACRWEWVRC